MARLPVGLALELRLATGMAAQLVLAPGLVVRHRLAVDGDLGLRLVAQLLLHGLDPLGATTEEHPLEVFDLRRELVDDLGLPGELFSLGLELLALLRGEPSQREEQQLALGWKLLDERVDLVEVRLAHRCL